MSRIGALRYLNALPLIDALEKDPAVTEICYRVPSLLASDLAAGRFDLALVPQVEACRDPRYRIVPGLAIGCRGAVDSILLFSTREWGEIRRVGVDVASRSSVELLRVLFSRRGGTAPSFRVVSPRLDPLRSPSPELDAVLLIGDRALTERRAEFRRYDLGAVWFEETGLPFVFAVWLGHEGVRSDAIQAVCRAAKRGLDRRRELAEEFSREHPEVADAATAERYLTDVIRYELGPAEIESLSLFHRLRVEAGLPPAPSWTPKFFEGYD